MLEIREDMEELGSQVPGWTYNQYGAGGINRNYDGQNGTGGLLIIYADKIEINTGATISSNGKNGGSLNSNLSYKCSGGGGSGGGSINIFYKDSYNNSGSIRANGGTGGTGEYSYGVYSNGGNGGTGSISVGQILDGTYENTYTNY